MGVGEAAGPSTPIDELGMTHVGSNVYDVTIGFCHLWYVKSLSTVAAAVPDCPTAPEALILPDFPVL